jgi:phosphoribosylaminoimidazole-succinocarboxamide synthase
MGKPVTGAEPLHLGHYPLLRSGKVRDIYDAGDHLLLVASDRLSAFDVILPTQIPDKGKLLTSIAEYWFHKTAHICSNHLVSTDIASLDLNPTEAAQLRGRTMVGRKAERIDIECVVRGYLAGSGYKEYAAYGTLAGEPLPFGLQLGDALPEPRFTPAIKNDEGHDENISRQQLHGLIDPDLADTLEKMSLRIFAFATQRAARAGFVLADTKFEFGRVDGELIVIDEILTPDSSRYWDASMLEPGKEPPSFDKQIVRDWLETQPWDKTAPGPVVPASIMQKARERYEAVYNRLTSIDDGQE